MTDDFYLRLLQIRARRDRHYEPLRGEAYRRAIESRVSLDDMLSWFRWMLVNDPHPRYEISTVPADSERMDCLFWADVSSHERDEVREKFRTFDFVPVEIRRTPLDERTAVAEYRLLCLPVDSYERDEDAA